MHEMGLFTLSIINTDGPGMEKGWKPALGPGTFFRNDVQKSANFLCISAYKRFLASKSYHLGVICMRWAYSPCQLLILMGLGWKKVGSQPWALALFSEMTSKKVPIFYVFLHISVFWLLSL